MDSIKEGLATISLALSTGGTSLTIGPMLKLFSVIISAVLYIVLSICSYILAAVGGLFNWVFEYTVVHIKDNIDHINVVTTAWSAVRDIANICFIFILLYLAIATILQLDEHGVKHSLSRLIIAAILINFSLLFVKVVIDVPNILAIEIYNKAIVNVQKTGVANTNGGNPGLGDAFFYMIAPQQAFLTGVQSTILNTAGLATGVGPVSSVVNAAAAIYNTENPITTFAMGIILMVIAIAVFAAVIIIFIKRFVMLVFYMIFSPLAFAGMAIPIHSLQSMTKEEFWMGLIKEAFYAPVFMMCVYITLVTGYGVQTATQPVVAGWGFLNSINLGVLNIFSYSVVIVMLVASLTIAEKMGVKGASGAMNVFKGITGGAIGAVSWAGGAAWRNTGSAIAYNVIEKTGLGTVDIKQMRQGMIRGKQVPWVFRGAVRATGNALTGGLQKAGSAHHGDIEKDMAAFTDSLHELRDNPEKQAELWAEAMKGHPSMGGTVYPYNLKIAKYVAEKMKPDELANMALFMEAKGKRENDTTYKESSDHMIDYTGKEKAADIRNLMKNKALPFHRVEAEKLIEQAAASGSRTDADEFFKFAGSLNDRQASSVFGGLTADHENLLKRDVPDSAVAAPHVGPPVMVKSELHKAFEKFTDNRSNFNYAEQLQRDATAGEFTREVVAKSLYQSGVRAELISKAATANAMDPRALQLLRKMLYHLEDIDDIRQKYDPNLTPQQFDQRLATMNQNELAAIGKMSKLYSKDDAKIRFIGKEGGQRNNEKPEQILDDDPSTRNWTDLVEFVKLKT